MSYILDALKKSEQERQENQAPTVHSVYPGSRFSKEKSSTPWLISVLLVSIISGLMVSGFWWYSRSDQIVATTEIANNGETKNNISIKNENNSKAVVDLKPVNPVAPLSENSIPESGLQESPIAKNSLVTISSDVSGDQVEEDLLPLMQVVELPDDVRSSMPPMAYSFHVYSTDKTKCTIIINNRRYREGELIGSGWVLDTITETGIVVRKNRYRVAIQVVDNW